MTTQLKTDFFSIELFSTIPDRSSDPTGVLLCPLPCGVFSRIDSELTVTPSSSGLRPASV